jgi:hypothetical protein
MDTQISWCIVADKIEANFIDVIHVCGGRDRFPEIFFTFVINIPRIELVAQPSATNENTGGEKPNLVENQRNV